MLTDKQAVSKIRKAFNKSTYKEFEEEVNFYVDLITATSYAWDFEFHGERTQIKCDKRTGKIEFRSTPLY